MATMKTTLEVVEKPLTAPPDTDEIFVRLAFYEPDTETLEEPALAFTMPVSDMLRMLYGISCDLREIIQDDLYYQMMTPPIEPQTWGMN
jgi:hypothetical protein